MKKLINKLMTKVFIVITILTITLSCSKKEDEIAPLVDDPKLKEEVAKLELKGDEGIAELVTDATNVEETPNGYKLEGSIGAEMEDGSSFNIAEGNFQFVVDVNGNIIKISGEGKVDFPNIGIFEKIRESFTWDKIKSHIEYETGKFYKENYNTDIPLNNDRYYFHFQVFDENDEEGFTLKHLGNLVVYNFTDFYLDVNDPAVLFKVQLWKPGSGAKSEATSIAKKLFLKTVSLGKGVKDYASAPGIIFGISNQATIKTSSYEFSKPEVFEELFGYNGFDELNAHGYVKLKNIPIPETVVLRLSGDMYIHGPLEKGAPSPSELIEKRQSAYVDWFNESELGPVTRTVNGSIDFGGKGIGAVFGILNGIDNALGYDVLNNDFNFDLVGAAYQEQSSGLSMDASSFLRFGGEFRVPILAEIFGEKISKHLFGPPSPTGFLYFNIEDELDNWSLFIESSADILIPNIGGSNFINSYFLVNKDGVSMEGNLSLPTHGIFNFDSKFKGMIGPEGFALESEYGHDITLPNNITLAHRNLMVKVSSELDKGLYLEGSIGLPLGVTEANVLASINLEKALFEGAFSQGLDLGYGFELPSRDMTFKTSTDPSEGISYLGEMEVPHIGYNKIAGIYNTTEFSFTGEVDRTIDFNGVNLPIANGHLSMNSDGISLGGSYSLPFGLKTAQMNGSITREEITQSGSMSTGISIAGTTFNFSNSYIRASSLTGVKLGGNINLKVFTTKVDGEILPGGNFRLTGAHTYNSKFLVTKINVVVTQAGINLSGTGTIYGVLGNKLASGKITFKPNWAAGTISACINGFCVDL